MPFQTGQLDPLYAKGSCKTCADGTSDGEVFIRCDGGRVISDIVDAVYGAKAHVPAFTGSKQAAMCISTEAESGMACVSSKAHTIDAVGKLCLGKSNCRITVANIDQELNGVGPNACSSSEEMRLKVIAKCVDMETMIPAVATGETIGAMYQSRPAPEDMTTGGTHMKTFFGSRALMANTPTALIADGKILSTSPLALKGSSDYADGKFTIHQVSVTTKFLDTLDDIHDTWSIRVTGLKVGLYKLNPVNPSLERRPVATLEPIT
jgi:hypothetical protein